MRAFRFYGVFILLTMAGLGCKSAGQKTHATASMKLVWSDEFEGTGLPNSKKWNYEQGDGCPNLCGWGNAEQQFYTSFEPKNARLEEGYLVIEAHKEKRGESEFTSARLITKGVGDWKYGRMDIRAKLPMGKGVWPAIWMLPTDNIYGNWPASGEIDIMENVGYLPDSIFGSIHTERFNHMRGTQFTGGFAGKTWSTDFHLYSIVWNAQSIDFLVDDRLYQSFKNKNIGFEGWPFDQKFHLVLNVAVGGHWGGKMGVDPDIWPQKMLVDYVRVYQ